MRPALLPTAANFASSAAAAAPTSRDSARRLLLAARGAAAAVVAGFVGVWDGALYPDGTDASVAFSMLQTAGAPAVTPRARASGAGVDANGSGGGGGVDPIVGRVAFAGGRDDARVAATVRLLEASATTYVALVGPYYDAALDAQVVTVLEGRRAGDRMWGTFRTRPVVVDAATDREVPRWSASGRFAAVKMLRAAA